MLKTHGKSSRARRCRFRQVTPAATALPPILPGTLQVFEKLHE